MANDDDIETCDTCGLDVEGPHPHQVSAAYVNMLERTLKGLNRRTDRNAYYRVVAELEDISDGHWDGPRTDDPPENWS